MPFVGEPKSAPGWVPKPIAGPWDLGSAAIRRTLKRAKTARRITPGARLKLPFEAFSFRTEDGVRLAAWFVPGSSDVNLDAGGLFAVLHHHYGGQRATVLPWIEFFYRLGIPSLSFDARGHGDSESSPVGRGSFVRRAADVEAACEEARRRGGERLLAFGQSQGAAALAIGISKRTDLAGCIFDSGPAPEMGTAAWGLAGNMLGLGSGPALGTRALLAARILPGTEPFRYPPALWSALGRLRSSPLLWIHGDRDRVIEPSWARLWFRWGARSAEHWDELLVPGADHVRCLQAAGPLVEGRVGAFVSSLVAAPAGKGHGSDLE